MGESPPGYQLLSHIANAVTLTFTSREQDDGVIPPQHTRRYLGLGLRAAMSGRNEVRAGDTKFGVFRM